MKFQNILLSLFLGLQATKAHVINDTNDVSENKNIFNYNFYCIKDNNHLCSKLNKKLANATNSLSKIL
eukprot:jgi/Orpsp1_1/1177934/evm.model.c7180000063404.1